MYVCIRTFTGNPGLGKRLTQKKTEIEKVLHKVPGFVSYFLVEAPPDQTITATLCREKTGAEQSVRIAAEWMKENMPADIGRPPQVVIGEVLFELGNVPAVR